MAKSEFPGFADGLFAVKVKLMECSCIEINLLKLL